MAEVSLNVQLLEMSANPISLIYAACRQCYSDKFAGDIFSDTALPIEKQEAFVEALKKTPSQPKIERFGLAAPITVRGRPISLL